MKNTGIRTMMLIALAIFLGTSIHAQNPNGRGSGQNGRGMGAFGQGDGTRLQQMLDLTEEQIEKLKEGNPALWPARNIVIPTPEI